MLKLALLSSLLLVSSALAAPVLPLSHLRFPPALNGPLCNFPILSLLCPRQSSDSTSVSTPLGTALGVSDNNSVRFSVKYASANRWEQSTVATSWELPNNATNPSVLPLVCPQNNVDDSTMAEDCLSMILYVPQSISTASKAPTLLWIHGGSFVSGSATGAGLDGANLAEATDSIVAVVQYRLGALGLFAPDGTTNLAVNDIISALQFLHQIVPSFGGNASKITLAGQSSGATLIRAMLAVSSASSLFQSAILQSDPMDYGFLSSGTQQALQNFFNGQINCSSSDKACQSALSVDAILNAQDNLAGNATSLDASTGQGEPLRPVHDGVLLTTTLTSSTPFPQQSKPILLTNVRNEAALTIYGEFPSPIGEAVYEAVVSSLGSSEGTHLLQNTNYAVPTSDSTDSADLRVQLEVLGTDEIWRCATWQFARDWTSNGGTAFVGVYELGATYPGNEQTAICTEGDVCHQDDIEIVFGTVSSPTAAQATLIKEMQARYKSFLSTGNPNASGFSSWNAATSSSNVNALQLGGSGQVAAGACDGTVWGTSAVPFDYQTFNL